ncbi:hypothetical protein NDU88_001934 [Pleurodeles waltl]|uniref:Uncharacterized protein n=1 Tax=Pleurodeles waltl TaxID=8319 RepID=A0AAV7P5E5_PLEWA|nr:hypothetical protein NDU88_001934 [Pleurodeles waltl]
MAVAAGEGSVGPLRGGAAAARRAAGVESGEDGGVVGQAGVAGEVGVAGARGCGTGRGSGADGRRRACLRRAFGVRWRPGKKAAKRTARWPGKMARRPRKTLRGRGLK